MQEHRERPVRALADELVRAPVPDVDRPGPVLALGDLALEVRVLERMILDVHGERALAAAQRHAPRQRPARKHAIALEPQVVVQAPRDVTLDDEDRVSAPLLRDASSSGSGVRPARRFARYSSRSAIALRSVGSPGQCAAGGCNVPSPPIVVCALVVQRHLVRVTTMGAVK